jgi:D-glycero-alpha-D-manno-heptose-7-phosphate kinase
VKLLQHHLMLFFTGFSRTSSVIAAEQIKKTPDRKSELSKMFLMVNEAVNILNSDNAILDFGKLLNESWQLKRSLTGNITTPYIDFIYDKAISSGATGGKLLGAGGGGFLLLFVKPEFQSRVREGIPKLLEVPFLFENQGSQIIYYEPDAISYNKIEINSGIKHARGEND